MVKGRPCRSLCTASTDQRNAALRASASGSEQMTMSRIVLGIIVIGIDLLVCIRSEHRAPYRSGSRTGVSARRIGIDRHGACPTNPSSAGRAYPPGGIEVKMLTLDTSGGA